MSVLGVPFPAQGESEVKKVKRNIAIIPLAFSVNNNQGVFFLSAKLRGKCEF